MAGPGGIEPPTLGLGEHDWERFRKWLYSEYSAKHALSVYLYARKYAHSFFSGDLSELKIISNGKRKHVMNALSALSKFIGAYEYWRRLVAAYGLKWSNRSDELILSRIGKSYGEIIEWVEDVRRVSGLELFVEFAAVTGLRLSEAINSWNLIDADGYYDRKLQALEHFKF